MSWYPGKIVREVFGKTRTQIPDQDVVKEAAENVIIKLYHWYLEYNKAFPFMIEAAQSLKDAMDAFQSVSQYNREGRLGMNLEPLGSHLAEVSRKFDELVNSVSKMLQVNIHSPIVNKSLDLLVRVGADPFILRLVQVLRFGIPRSTLRHIRQLISIHRSKS